MRARNRKTRAPIVRLRQLVHGHSDLDTDGFGRGDDGRLTCRESDGFVPDWSTVEPIEHDGAAVYIDADCEQVGPKDIELYDAADETSGGEATPAATQQ